MMRALFVHGMGRTSLSGRPMLRRLSRAGIATEVFDYMVSMESFDAIRQRLVARIDALAAGGEYMLIGHSLGGVIIRAALADTPSRPWRVFILGSPSIPSRIAHRMAGNPAYRTLAGDCGQLLGSAPRMSAVPRLDVPVTNIIGTRGSVLTGRLFGDEPNDGIVAVDEVRVDWIDDEVEVPVLHTWLPASRRVADIILQRLQARESNGSSGQR